MMMIHYFVYIEQNLITKTKSARKLSNARHGNTEAVYNGYPTNAPCR